MFKLKLFNSFNKNKASLSAFTIVELLVVIVVIGILAAITVVSYTGVSQKAVDASLQSDLAGAKTKLQLYQVEYGSFPTAMTNTSGTLCPSAPTIDNQYCITPSSGNSFTYTGTRSTFILDNAKSTTNYRITESTAPVVFVIPTGPETVTIGSQVWMKYNLNVGAMVNGGTVQTTSQKWCYNNLESNCTTYGGLYQWNTAMNGSTTEGAQGICPVGFHVPTDGEWKALETFLGVAPAELDRFGDTTTNQGAALKVGGSTGLNVLLAGKYSGSSFMYFETETWLISSTPYVGMPGTVLYRDLKSSKDTILRFAFPQTNGYSVRCIKN